MNSDLFRVLIAAGAVVAVGACTVQGQVAGAGSAPVPGASSAAPPASPSRAPVVLASGQDYPAGIAADEARVYWGNWKGGQIASVPAQGGPVSQLVTGMHPYHLRVDANTVYWTDSDPHRAVDDGSKNGAVMSVPKAGGKPKVLASGLGWAGSIAIDATSVFYTDKAYGIVAKVPLAGGPPTILAQGLPALEDIDVDATHVYWVAGGEGTPAAVSRVDKNGGAPTAIFPGGRLEMGLGPGGVFFRKQEDLWRGDVDGKNAAKVAFPGPFQPRSIAAAQASTFVLGRDGFSSESPFAIYELTAAGAVNKIADKLPDANPGELAVNQTGVYLVDGQHGTVTRFAR